MPRERKKRGRRQEEKAKRALEASDVHDDNTEYPPQKRRKSAEPDFIPIDTEGSENVALSLFAADVPFYGVLDSGEQEYFKRVDDLLAADQFPTSEEKAIFVESVWREANGKELKVACSQSSSRVLERLITISEEGQLKNLFAKFEGHFLHLVQHRFASHCCEAMFLIFALGITKEQQTSKKTKRAKNAKQDSPSMELQLISVLSELKGNIGFLLTERFASHTLRLLLAILSGDVLDLSTLASKRKESTGTVSIWNELQHQRPVPEGFLAALDKLTQESLSGLDDTYIRALATHPTGSPTLYLLLKIEISRHGKSKEKEQTSILRRLVPDDSIVEGSVSHTFLKGLLYDPVGSRLLEGIILNAPGKIFKSIYRGIFKDRLGTIAKNDTASFVVLRVLDRLGKDDLEDAMPSILAEAPTLIKRSMYSVLKTLIDRCIVRQIPTTPIRNTLQRDDCLGIDPKLFMMSMLDLENPDAPPEPHSSTRQRHGAHLAQSMLQASVPLCDLVFEGLLALPVDQIIAMAKTTGTSRFIQDCLTCPSSIVSFRRKFIPLFTGHLANLSTNARGYHTVDALWIATDELFFLKERFIDELARAEAELRGSYEGSKVWSNWMVDLYKKNRRQWIASAKDSGKLAGDHDDHTRAPTKKPKSALDQARSRFASRGERQQVSRTNTFLPVNA